MAFFTNDPLKIAFIGGAVNSAIGYTHFNASRLDGHFRVDAGCFSRDPEQNVRSSKVYGVDESRCYSSWEQLLDAERGHLDAIVVLTPTPDHAPIVIAALRAGYSVICEKALGTSSQECQAMYDAVAGTDGYLAVTYNYSGYPMVRQLRQMIIDGHFGKLQQIHIEMPQEGFLRLNAQPQKWRLQDYAVPTVSLDLGVHVHHLIDFLSLGAQPYAVVGDQTSYGQLSGIIDNVYCLARYTQDLFVQAWWGKTALGSRNGLRFRVFGEKGSAEWYQMTPEVLSCANNDGHLYQIDRGSKEAKLAQEMRYSRFKAGHPSGFIEAFSNLYADFAHELIARNQGQHTKSGFVYGASHSVDGLKMLEAISYSATEGKWVSLA